MGKRSKQPLARAPSTEHATPEEEPLALRMLSDVNLVHAAVSNNMLPQVRAWIDEMAGDVNVRGGVGMTALHVAAISGHDDMVRLLLQRGASINAQSAIGITALMSATAKGWEKVVGTLLDAHADATLVDHQGVSALDRCARGGRGVQRLLEGHLAAAPPRAPVPPAAPRAPARRAPLPVEEQRELQAEVARKLESKHGRMPDWSETRVMTETNLLGYAPRRVLSEREMRQVARRIHGRCDGDLVAYRPQRESRRTHPCPTMSEQEHGKKHVGAGGASRAWGSPELLLRAGQTVRLAGLSRAELNAQTAVVLFYHSQSGRWAVKLDASGADMRVRAHNLLIAFDGEAYEEGARPHLWPGGPPTWCAATETLRVGWQAPAADGAPAVLSFSCPRDTQLHEAIWAFLSPQLEHVNSLDHQWVLDDCHVLGARYTLSLRRGAATAAEASGAQLGELTPYYALLRALRQATARAAHWWTVAAEPALCVVPCHITPEHVRYALPIFYGNQRVGSLGQPGEDSRGWEEVARLPVPHTKGSQAGRPSSVTFGSFAKMTSTDVASAVVAWAVSAAFELETASGYSRDFALDFSKRKRGLDCERTEDLRRKSRAARAMPDAQLLAKLADAARLAQGILEPWGVLVRLDGAGAPGPTEYFARLESGRRGEHYDDEHGGLYTVFTEAQLRSFYLNAAADEPVLPENEDGENYRYNWGQVLTSLMGTGALDPETESVRDDDGEVEEEDDDDDDGSESVDSEEDPRLAGLMERLAGLDRQGTKELLNELR